MNRRKMAPYVFGALCMNILFVPQMDAGLWNWYNSAKTKVCLAWQNHKKKIIGTAISGAVLGTAGYWVYKNPDVAQSSIDLGKSKCIRLIESLKKSYADFSIKKFGKKFVPLATLLSSLVGAYNMLADMGTGLRIAPEVLRPDYKHWQSFNDHPNVQVKALIETLYNWGESSSRPAELDGGYIFYGPPGSGKTALMKHLAGISQRVQVISLSGSSLLSPDILSAALFSANAQRCAMRLSFNKEMKTIIFIDEFDRVACKRRTGTSEDQKYANMVSILLEHIDGVASKDDVIFIGATNFPKALDRAIWDRMETIEIPAPDKQEILLSIENNLFNQSSGNLQLILNMEDSERDKAFSQSYNRDILDEYNELKSIIHFFDKQTFEKWSYRTVNRFNGKINGEINKSSPAPTLKEIKKYYNEVSGISKSMNTKKLNMQERFPGSLSAKIRNLMQKNDKKSRGFATSDKNNSNSIVSISNHMLSSSSSSTSSSRNSSSNKNNLIINNNNNNQKNN